MTQIKYKLNFKELKLSKKTSLKCTCLDIISKHTIIIDILSLSVIYIIITIS